MPETDFNVPDEEEQQELASQSIYEMDDYSDGSDASDLYSDFDSDGSDFYSGLDDSDLDDSDEEQGLTFQRIQQFEQFTADESHVDDQCAICMGDIEAGRNMMRLNCNGNHTFCQFCIERWFADHNTCPICRHKF